MSEDGASHGIEEMPWVAEVMAIVDKDLEASRSLLARLLAISDALLAATVTVGGLFVGLAASTSEPVLAYIAVPVMLAITYTDGLNWAQFRRVAYRIRRLEKLYQSYVVALRERGAVREPALEVFERDLVRYEFGIERQLRSPGVRDVWKTNLNRSRWWLLVALSVSPLVVGISLTTHHTSRSCVRLTDGSIVQTADAATVVGGAATVVACPTSAMTPTSTSSTPTVTS